MLRLKLGCQDNTNGIEYKFFQSNPDSIKHLTYNAGGGGNEYWVANYVTASQTSINVTKNKNIKADYTSNNVTASYDNPGYMNCIQEIIGIGRKA